MTNLLDNIAWQALTGPHAKFAAGSGGARRYAAGFSPIVAFADLEQPDFLALAAFCEHGEHFYVGGWSGHCPSGWRVDEDSTMLKMVWDAPIPPDDEAPDATQLGPEHAKHALEIATLMRPGPFGIRTIQLGDYFGYFDNDRLVSMAGERMFAGSYREISGVCTLPEFRGRGLARKRMLKLVRLELLRNEIPFLHVMSANQAARQLYERLGFRNYKEVVVRVVSKC